MHERPVRRPHELRPAVVDVLAELRARIGDLPVARQVDQVLELALAEAPAYEPELHRRLLAALGEVTLVEREAKFAVLQDEVVAGVVVAAFACLHGWSASNAGRPGEGIRSPAS